jgi:hypothetical protein
MWCGVVWCGGWKEGCTANVESDTAWRMSLVLLACACHAWYKSPGFLCAGFAAVAAGPNLPMYGPRLQLKTNLPLCLCYPPAPLPLLLTCPCASLPHLP